MNSPDAWTLAASWLDERVVNLRRDARKARTAYTETGEFGRACMAYARELEAAATQMLAARDIFLEKAAQHAGKEGSDG